MDILQILFILFFFFLLFMNFKTFNANNNREKITKAIKAYQLNNLISQGNPYISYEDMRSYYGTIFRFWDWGYKHIIPKEKLKLLEPFIKIEEEKAK